MMLICTKSNTTSYYDVGRLLDACLLTKHTHILLDTYVLIKTYSIFEFNGS